MTRSRAAAGRLRNRRGAVLVLVAITLVVLIGFTGVGVDGGRLYAFRAQMQRTTDAAALAAITGVGVGDWLGAPDTALLYVDRNRLMGNATAVVPRDSVEPGTWDIVNRQFVPNGGLWDASVMAVRVTGNYTAPLTFTQVLGLTTAPIRTRSVAMRGYVGATDCVKPWAVSYRTMLDVLYPPAGSKSLDYDLTADDITKLAASGSEINLLNDNTDPNTPGNIAQVQTYPGTGNNAYRDAIQGCSEIPIAPGDTIHTDAGAGPGQTQNAVEQLCDDNGGTSGDGQSFTCLGKPPVKLIIWDYNNGLSGANLDYYVKYIGVFKISGFSKVPGGTFQVSGSFSSMASTGAFSAEPTPIIRPGGVLVE